VRVVASPESLGDAEVIVMPGVGASAPAMRRLRRRGLVGPIVERVQAGAWYLGICLGMQLLFERSAEDGAHMLGLLPGDVEAIPRPPRLPHIGWNRLEVRRHHPVLEGLADGTPAYFVHSYAPVPADPADVVAETEHGGRFASLIARDRIIGFQFHPERSGDDGLRMLRNALDLVRDAPGGARRASAPAPAVQGARA
jgi:glutamine amidotransferase